MSMSQFPDMDEQWDEICSRMRWWHVILMAGMAFVVIPITVLAFTVWGKLTGKRGK